MSYVIPTNTELFLLHLMNQNIFFVEVIIKNTMTTLSKEEYLSFHMITFFSLLTLLFGTFVLLNNSFAKQQ